MAKNTTLCHSLAVLASAMVFSSVAATAAVDVKQPVKVENLSAGGNQFGLSLFKRVEIDNKQKNLFLSPLSLHSCMHMVANGAVGDTAKQMNAALGLDDFTKEQANQLHQQLIEILTTDKAARNSQFVFEDANSIWASKDIKLKPEFVDETKKFFSAEVTNLDFKDKESPQRINSWVSDKTHGKIDNIIGGLSEDDIVVLVNAAYMKARWKNVFQKDATKPQAFHLLSGTPRDVPMMDVTGRFNYLDNEELQGIELPYDDGETAMFVFLPKEKTTLHDFVQSLNLKKWDEMLQKLEPARGELTLPRFKYSYEIQCREVLKQEGITLAFTGGANFSNMVQPPPPASLSEVKHKAFIKVDEEGTEAAAATAAMMKALSAMPLPEVKPFKMNVDRPFFFAVWNWRTRSIIFAGQVVEPEET